MNGLPFYKGPCANGLRELVCKKKTVFGALVPSITGSPPIRRDGPLVIHVLNLMAVKLPHCLAPNILAGLMEASKKSSTIL